MVISKGSKGRGCVLRVMFPGPCHQPLFDFFICGGDEWCWSVSWAMHCLGSVIYGPLFFRSCNILLHSEERFKNIQKLGKYYLSFKNKIHEQMYISTLSPYRWAKNIQLSWQQNVQYHRRKNRKKKEPSCQLLYHSSSCWIWVLLSWNFNSKTSRPCFSSSATSASCNLPVICLRSCSSWDTSTFSRLAIYLDGFSLEWELDSK